MDTTTMLTATAISQSLTAWNIQRLTMCSLQKLGTTPVYKSYDIELVSPAEGTLTFKAAGKQCVWKLSLTTTTPTGISEINTDEKNAGKIYNLQGVEMKGSLQPGIYIRNGKKFVVK